jgi:hypothetical protein
MEDKRAMHERHLAQCNGHVAQGNGQIANQRAIIAALKAAGRSLSAATNFLDVLLDTQAAHERHRERILKELKAPAKRNAPRLSCRAEGLGAEGQRDTGFEVGRGAREINVR